jgi:hypothetical protein
VLSPAWRVPLSWFTTLWPDQRREEQQPQPGSSTAHPRQRRQPDPSRSPWPHTSSSSPPSVHASSSCLPRPPKRRSAWHSSASPLPRCGSARPRTQQRHHGSARGGPLRVQHSGQGRWQPCARRNRMIFFEQGIRNGWRTTIFQNLIRWVPPSASLFLPVVS